MIGGPGKTIPNNTHFDTTRANVEFTGAEAVDLVIEEGRHPAVEHPFKGNMDLGSARRLPHRARPGEGPGRLGDDHQQLGRRPAGLLENLRGVREICDRHGVPLFLDACRFAENAWFIKTASPGRRARSVPEIVREIASLADGMTMSAKKDGLANIGGWLAVNDDALAEQCRNLLILTEGFPTYGGLAGRDLEAIAQGLREVVERGLPALPDHEHGLPRRRARTRPACPRSGRSAATPSTSTRAPCCRTSRRSSTRARRWRSPSTSRAGSAAARSARVMFGRHPDGTESPAAMDLVRLAIPRRTYTQSHVDYCIEVVRWVAERARDLRGYRIVDEPPALRHFTARFAPLTCGPSARPDRAARVLQPPSGGTATAPLGRGTLPP